MAKERRGGKLVYVRKDGTWKGQGIQNELPNNDKGVIYKQAQLNNILDSNPMTDDYHTGIRTIDDIKTVKEILNSSEDDDLLPTNPDFTKKDLQDAYDSGYITVYSSYSTFRQGDFISTSKMMAQSYAGSGQVYTKKMKIDDIAFINGDEGQIAKVTSQDLTKASKQKPITKTPQQKTKVVKQAKSSITSTTKKVDTGNAKIYKTIPSGWQKINGGNAPAGYAWISNGKSRFSKEYEKALIKL